MSNKRAGRATALFDDAAFAEDLNRASDTGRQVALATRSEYEQNGVPVDHLLVYAAFGVRHHPRDSRAPTVYEIAHQRIHYLTRLHTL